MLFDTHCHIYDEQYKESIDEIISKCLSFDVQMMMVIGDNITHSKICDELSKKYDCIYSAVGVHPEEVDTDELSSLEEQLTNLVKSNPKIKAIGEIGLDYHWKNDEYTKNKQKEYFIKQIEIANKLNLPIIIHARDSIQDCIEILKASPCICKGVFHCFSGSVEQAKIIIQMGYYIGLDGPVTYKNAKTPKEVAKIVPLDKLVVETDSPYLPPVPHRGEINYPYYVREIVNEIALLREMSPKEIEDVTYVNGKRLYKI
jgi:TatD DNase family protein